MRIGVISDTHVPTRAKRLRPGVFEAFKRVDVILHAGDVIVAEVLRELEKIAPVHAVLGNNDRDELRNSVPLTINLEFEEIRIGMVHDAMSLADLPAHSGLSHIQEQFPSCQVVIFGHTHVPSAQSSQGMLLLNPGSPTVPAKPFNRSVALLEVDGSRVEHSFVEI